MAISHVFCDESHMSVGYRVQGGIWVPDEGMRTVRQAFADLRARHPKLTELKWTYINGQKPLTIYSELVDLFFKSPAAPCLSFKCMVVRKEDDPSTGLGKTEKDLGFYRAYFTLLRWRLAGDSYVRIDRRSSPLASPEAVLGRCLNATAERDELPFKVLSCTAPSAKSEDLIQLADVLCGAVGWAWNQMKSTCGAKPIFHQHICKYLGWHTLQNRSTGATATKFNVWHYRPKK